MVGGQLAGNADDFGGKVIVSSIPGSGSTDLDSMETGWAITEQY